MLDELDNGIDKNINNLEKTRGKMVKLMEETSKCCLITTIIVELAALILMLIFLWKYYQIYSITDLIFIIKFYSFLNDKLFFKYFKQLNINKFDKFLRFY